MLSPSDFNNAVPQFTNGNYASNPINPQYIAEPDAESYNRGTEPLQTLPAQWWNWFLNKFTARFNKVNIYVKNIFNELAQVLSIFSITPDGTEQTPTTSQLKTVFETCYPQYVKTVTTGTAVGCIPTVGTALGTTNNNILVTDSTGKLKPSGITVGTAAGCDSTLFARKTEVDALYGNIAGTALGTAAVGTCTTFARSDHVHPADIPVTLAVTSTEEGNWNEGIRINRTALTDTATLVMGGNPNSRVGCQNSFLIGITQYCGAKLYITREGSWGDSYFAPTGAADGTVYWHGNVCGVASCADSATNAGYAANAGYATSAGSATVASCANSVFVVNPGNSTNWSEGIRINKAVNGWTTMTFGGDSGSDSGCTGVFSMHAYEGFPGKLFLAYQGSNNDSYFAPTGAADGSVYWHGRATSADCATSATSAGTASCANSCFIVNPGNASNWSEGIRLNRATNGWTTLTFGGESGSVSGCTDTFSMHTFCGEPGKLFLAYQGSNNDSYFAPTGAADGSVYWHGNATSAGVTCAFGRAVGRRNETMKLWSVEWNGVSEQENWAPECDIYKAICWATNGNFATMGIVGSLENTLGDYSHICALESYNNSLGIGYCIFRTGNASPVVIRCSCTQGIIAGYIGGVYK